MFEEVRLKLVTTNSYEFHCGEQSLLVHLGNHDAIVWSRLEGEGG